jgi:hypothetical protein
MDTGFIITRHVNSEKTDNYWKECYNCIRKWHPDLKIIIIDDNSDQEKITDMEVTNCEVIRSQYIGRGELLPYYYLLTRKLFDRAIIIHDSVFLHEPINFENVDTVKFLWHFQNSS